MTAALQMIVLLLTAVAASGVVSCGEPLSQAISLSFYGLVLAVLFLLYQAPDVALSQLVVGAVALPLLILLALARIDRDRRETRA